MKVFLFIIAMTTVINALAQLRVNQVVCPDGILQSDTVVRKTSDTLDEVYVNGKHIKFIKKDSLNNVKNYTYYDVYNDSLEFVASESIKSFNDTTLKIFKYKKSDTLVSKRYLEINIVREENWHISYVESDGVIERVLIEKKEGTLPVVSLFCEKQHCELDSMKVNLKRDTITKHYAYHGDVELLSLLDKDFTSYLSNIDYFLTGESINTKNGQKEYSFTEEDKKLVSEVIKKDDIIIHIKYPDNCP